MSSSKSVIPSAHTSTRAYVTHAARLLGRQVRRRAEQRAGRSQSRRRAEAREIAEARDAEVEDLHRLGTLATCAAAHEEVRGLEIASVVFETSSAPSRIERFASAGIGCGGASMSLLDLVLHESGGVGVLAVDCVLSVDRVEIDATLASPGSPGIGIAASGSTLDVDTLSLHDSPGFGVFATGTTSVLTAVSIERMEQAGLWVEGGSSLTVTSSTLRDNAGAAIAAVGASMLRITDCEITDTDMAPLPRVGGLASEPMGDGIHVAEGPGTALEVALTRVDLIGNARVGLVLDGAGESLSIALEAIEVDAPESALGAVAQRVSGLPADWDMDVVRLSSAARDAAAAELAVSDGTLYGILMPPTLAP